MYKTEMSRNSKNVRYISNAKLIQVKHNKNYTYTEPSGGNLVSRNYCKNFLPH
jgi:hypothetical protein